MANLIPSSSISAAKAAMDNSTANLVFETSSSRTKELYGSGRVAAPTPPGVQALYDGTSVTGRKIAWTILKVIEERNGQGGDIALVSSRLASELRGKAEKFFERVDEGAKLAKLLLESSGMAVDVKVLKSEHGGAVKNPDPEAIVTFSRAVG